MAAGNNCDLHVKNPQLCNFELALIRWTILCRASRNGRLADSRRGPQREHLITHSTCTLSNCLCTLSSLIESTADCHRVCPGVSLGPPLLTAASKIRRIILAAARLPAVRHHLSSVGFVAVAHEYVSDRGDNATTQHLHVSRSRALTPLLCAVPARRGSSRARSAADSRLRGRTAGGRVCRPRIQRRAPTRGRRRPGAEPAAGRRWCRDW